MQNNSDIKNFLSELGLNNVLNIEQDLGDGFVKLKISEAERRQALQDIKSVEDIIIELLRNSRDASAKNIFIGTKKIENKIRNIYFIDDGIGIPERLHSLIFEARVTSKLENPVKDSYGLHGRGMALFSIKLNAKEIKVVFSKENQGTSFFLSIDLDKIHEKKGQNILPQIIEENGNLNIFGGVNNIFKILFDFKLQNPNINIYYGTPAQIILAMRESLKKTGIYNNLPKFEDWNLFLDYINNEKEQLKITYFPCLTENYLILNKIISNFFNINISERTAQRIIYEEFKPIYPITITLNKDNDIKNYNLFENIKINNDNNYNFNQNSSNLEYNDDIKNDNSRYIRKNLKLYEEQKLAFRFNDSEIKFIINKLNYILKEIGKKYLIEPNESNINIKRKNNNILINIEFKEKQ